MRLSTLLTPSTHSARFVNVVYHIVTPAAVGVRNFPVRIKTQRQCDHGADRAFRSTSCHYQYNEHNWLLVKTRLRTTPVIIHSHSHSAQHWDCLPKSTTSRAVPVIVYMFWTNVLQPLLSLMMIIVTIILLKIATESKISRHLTGQQGSLGHWQLPL